MSELVVEILEDFLGKSRKHYENKSQITFDCPECSLEKNMPDGDGKGNLEVNYNSRIYNCWACSEINNTHGTINKLIRKYGNNTHFKRYKLLIPDTVFTIGDIKQHTIDGLPKAFTPLYIERDNFDYYKAIEYLKKRNIGIDLIKKYNIGYAIVGDYKGRIIFPSYDSYGEINYYVGRSYDKYNKLKYKNPEVSKMEIIFNENRVNWDSNIYLVEGVFDHISIPNSIPMLGKVLNDILHKKLIEKAGSKIIIVLDYDAKKDAHKLYQKLNSSKLRNKILIVDMPKGFDIADVHQKLGNKGVIKLLSTAKKIKESLL